MGASNPSCKSSCLSGYPNMSSLWLPSISRRWEVNVIDSFALGISPMMGMEMVSCWLVFNVVIGAGSS